MIECEEMLKIVQGCRDSWLDSRVTRDWQVAKVGTPVKHAGKLKSHAVVALQDKSPRLARPLACGLNSRLSLVTRPSCQTTLFGKN